ncbi:hypothetical protein E9228_002587 [Curtobacterium flaccumfaciens]|uniref:Asp23/Gls24 family envelope stress response protein n=1 Tax=Curtobacterium salicis TaxID=1779862 RepID=A0ABX0TDJ3_9MICO|nr:hypothetical protein [Curtobacterium sp. WW7]NII41929.1 hypothetical protein [Curtobacterium sp. WW7]
MTEDTLGTEPVPDPVWTDDALLAVEAVVLDVAGVTDLYRGRTSVGSAVAAVRRLGSSDAAPRIAVDGAVLRIVIGTDGAAPAPTVARAVHDAVLAAARASGRQPTRIDVRVARIG